MCASVFNLHFENCKFFITLLYAFTGMGVVKNLHYVPKTLISYGKSATERVTKILYILISLLYPFIYFYFLILIDELELFIFIQPSSVASLTSHQTAIYCFVEASLIPDIVQIRCR